MRCLNTPGDRDPATRIKPEARPSPLRLPSRDIRDPAVPSSCPRPRAMLKNRWGQNID